jgi:hypothetical protein
MNRVLAAAVAAVVVAEEELGALDTETAVVAPVLRDPEVVLFLTIARYLLRKAPRSTSLIVASIGKTECRFDSPLNKILLISG